MECGGANATCHVQSSWAVGPPMNECAKEKTSISHKRPRGKRSGETPQAGGFKRIMCGVANAKCLVQSSWTVGPPMNSLCGGAMRNMPCPEQLDSGATNKRKCERENLNFTPKTSRQTERRGASSRRT